MATPPATNPTAMLRNSQLWKNNSIKNFDEITDMLALSSTTYEEHSSCGCHTYGYANGQEIKVSGPDCTPKTPAEKEALIAARTLYMQFIAREILKPDVPK